MDNDIKIPIKKNIRCGSRKEKTCLEVPEKCEWSNNKCVSLIKKQKEKKPKTKTSVSSSKSLETPVKNTYRIVFYDDMYDNIINNTKDYKDFLFLGMFKSETFKFRDDNFIKDPSKYPKFIIKQRIKAFTPLENNNYLLNFHINYLLEKGITKFAMGIITHLHISTLFCNLDEKSKNYGIYFFDSIANEASTNIINFMNFIYNQVLEKKNFKKIVNKKIVQYYSYACGIFSSTFIELMLDDKLKYDEIIDSFSENKMIEKRNNIFFPNDKFKSKRFGFFKNKIINIANFLNFHKDLYFGRIVYNLDKKKYKINEENILVEIINIKVIYKKNTYIDIPVLSNKFNALTYLSNYIVDLNDEYKYEDILNIKIRNFLFYSLKQEYFDFYIDYIYFVNDYYSNIIMNIELKLKLKYFDLKDNMNLINKSITVDNKDIIYKKEQELTKIIKLNKYDRYHYIK